MAQPNWHNSLPYVSVIIKPIWKYLSFSNTKLFNQPNPCLHKYTCTCTSTHRTVSIGAVKVLDTAPATAPLTKIRNSLLFITASSCKNYPAPKLELNSSRAPPFVQTSILRHCDCRMVDKKWWIRAKHEDAWWFAQVKLTWFPISHLLLRI